MTDKQEEFVAQFIENHNLNRMSRNIWRIFFDYLRKQNAGLPMDFNEILYYVEAIIELFVYLEKEDNN